MKSVDVALPDGMVLRTLVWPAAPGARSVLLVHGLASNALLWSQVGDLLAARGFAPVAVDLRGHGRSSKSDGPYDMRTVVGDLRQLVAVLALDRPLIVGQSWGGNLALEAVQSFPEVFAGGIGIDGGLIDLQTQWPEWEDCADALKPPPLVGMGAGAFRSRMRAFRPDWSDEAIEATLGNFEVLDDGTIRPWLTLDRHLLVLRGLWEHRPAEVVVGLQRPFLMLGAESDDPRSAERRARAERLAAGSPLVRTRWIVGDHDLHAQHPGVVADVITEFATLIED